MIVMARSPAKRVIGTLLFVLALIVVLAFYFIVFADAQNISDVPATEAVPEIAIGSAILLGVVTLVLFLMLVIRKSDEPAPAPADDAFFVPEDDSEPEPTFEEEPEPLPDEGDGMVVYDMWRLPVARRAWGADNEPRVHSFYYPLSVESGVYVNDYIALDNHPDGERLKLRTLLAGPKDFEAVSFTIPDEEPLEETGEPEPMAPSWGSEPAPRPPRPRRDEGHSDEFMDELERRFEERKARRGLGEAEPMRAEERTAVAVTTGGEEVYYDFTGDIHDVIDVEGIGGAYADKLRDAGIKTTARLCYEDPVRIASVTGAPRKTVASWQAMAEMMKVSGIGPQYAEALARAGIAGIDELKRRSASRIADQVNEFLDGLDTTVLGGTITERRVAGWQASAKSMRRVRQSVPES